MTISEDVLELTLEQLDQAVSRARRIMQGLDDPEDRRLISRYIDDLLRSRSFVARS